MEISRLMEKNDGKLFIIKHEKGGGMGLGGLYSRDDIKGDYYSGDELFGGYRIDAQGNIRERPIFRIKFKPRTCCKLHQEMISQPKKNSGFQGEDSCMINKRDLKALFKLEDHSSEEHLGKYNSENHYETGSHQYEAELEVPKANINPSAADNDILVGQNTESNESDANEKASPKAKLEATKANAAERTEPESL